MRRLFKKKSGMFFVRVKLARRKEVTENMFIAFPSCFISSKSNQAMLQTYLFRSIKILKAIYCD